MYRRTLYVVYNIPTRGYIPIVDKNNRSYTHEDNVYTTSGKVNVLIS